jgi:pimeloyl-ACP methyl ester carboxylesterase
MRRYEPFDTNEFFEGRYTDSFVPLNGVNIHYTDWGGTGEKPNLLMVHGINGQLHTLDPFADLLSEDYRVVSIDLRGHGDSAWTHSGYFVRDFVSDVVAFVDALDLQPFSLIGHSLGAKIGIGVGGAIPDAVDRLVLSDAGPEVPTSGARDVTRFTLKTRDQAGFSSEEALQDFYREMHPGWRDEFYPLDARYQARRNWANKLVLKADPDVVWVTTRVGAQENDWAWESLARCSMPTLVMWGCSNAGPQILNQDIVDRMMATLPDGQLAVFETSHFILREEPELFIEAIDAFLRGGGNEK